MNCKKCGATLTTADGIGDLCRPCEDARRRYVYSADSNSQAPSVGTCAGCVYDGAPELVVCLYCRRCAEVRDHWTPKA
jgi:hypothetical protein